MSYIQGLLDNHDLLTVVCIGPQASSNQTARLTFRKSRNGCAYVMRLCAEETTLFHQYFHLGEEELTYVVLETCMAAVVKS